MEKVYFDGITEMGACISNAMVVLPEDWTMTTLVNALKKEGYSMFRLSTMRRYVKVI